MGPPETRTLRMSRLDLGAPPPAVGKYKALSDLQHVLQVAAAGRLTVTRRAAASQVNDPAERIDHATSALAILDRLDNKVFAKPNLFTGREPPAGGSRSRSPGLTSPVPVHDGGRHRMAGRRRRRSGRPDHYAAQ